jgi:hypothetical protein
MEKGFLRLPHAMTETGEKLPIQHLVNITDGSDIMLTPLHFFYTTSGSINYGLSENSFRKAAGRE